MEVGRAESDARPDVEEAATYARRPSLAAECHRERVLRDLIPVRTFRSAYSQEARCHPDKAGAGASGQNFELESGISTECQGPATTIGYVGCRTE